LVAQSLTLVPAVAAAGHAALVPAQFHAPLAQRVVLLKGAPLAARAFHDFIVAPAAHAVWQRHGYTPPGA
jgi:molybdate transport system substrate-binding protein